MRMEGTVAEDRWYGGVLLLCRYIRENQTPSVFSHLIGNSVCSRRGRSAHQSPAVSSQLPERSSIDIMESDNLLAILSVRFCNFFLFFKADARAWPC